MCKKGAEFKLNHWYSRKETNSSLHNYTGNSLCRIRKNRNFPFFGVSNGRNVVPLTIWGILTTKTVYLTLLAFLILHPATHGKSGRCAIFRQIKYAQMFLHHFVCSVHFPTIQKHIGIETIPHFYWKMTRGLSLQMVFSLLFLETLFQ